MTGSAAAASSGARVLVLELDDFVFGADANRIMSIGGSSGGWAGDSHIDAIAFSSSHPAGNSDSLPWLTNGAAGNYDVKVALTSGTLLTGTTDTWLNLATARSWSTSGTAVLDVQIGTTGAATALVSSTITLTL